MTTIAYKDGVIAYDSRTTLEGAVCSDETNKRYSEKGREFFLCGPIADCQVMSKGWPNLDKELGAGGFMVEDGKVYRIGSDEDGPWQSEIDYYWAEGSGKCFAITAMDLGLSAKEAVKMAAKRDMATGGKIRTYRVRKDG